MKMQSIAFAVLAMTGTVIARPYVAGVDERVSVDVPDETVTEQSELVWTAENATLDKVGKGEWKLPLGMIPQSTDFTLNVREGSVTIPAADGPAPAITRPDEVLAKAALWLDPSVNCDCDGGSGVVCWRDVRETKTSVPYDHIRAVSMTDKTTNLPQVSPHTGNLKYIFFGKLTSGQWMRFVGTDASDASQFNRISGIKHVFAIHDVVFTQGYLFSEEPDGACPFHPYSYRGPWDAVMLNSDGRECPAQLGARFYFDGVRTDPTTTKPPRSEFHLWEFGFMDKDATASSLFNDRNVANRQGGDYVGEMIFFTNTLTEVERVQVERYLLDRWGLTKPAGSNRTIAVARGASVNLPPASSKVKVIGEGTIALSSDDLSAGFRNPDFRGSLDIPSGSTAVVRDDIYAYEAADGERITVEQGDNGTLVSRVADQAAGTVAKTGSGYARLMAIPEGTTKLVVREGTLSVSPVGRGTVTSGSSTVAQIASPSFEETDAPGGYGYLASMSQLEGTNWNWIGLILKDSRGSYQDSWIAMFNKYVKTSGFTYQNYPFAPDGQWVSVIRGPGALTTEVTIVDPGVYELDFAFAGLYSDPDTRIDAFIGRDADHLQPITRVYGNIGKGYSRQKGLTPELEAGTYLLRIQNTDAIAKHSSSIDDIKLRLVSRPSVSISIPNGGFEFSANPQWTRLFTPTVTADNWTFTQNDWVGDSSIAGAGIGRYGVVMKNAMASVALMGDMRGGQSQLVLASSGSSASTTFKPGRAGLYRLRARIGRWGHSSITKTINVHETPIVEARCTVGENNPVSLGSLTVEGRLMAEMSWPTVIRVSDPEESVSITVANTRVDGAAVLDDIELVPEHEYAQNLLTDGSFESEGTWEYLNNKVDDSDKSTAVRYPAHQYYGYDIADGAWQAWVIDHAAIYQEVSFPYAGRYRLRFCTRARHDTRYEANRYGPGARVKAVLARNGVTNDLYECATPTTNYVAHTVYFTVTDPGSYVFGFKGANEPTVSGMNDRMSLIDLVSIAYAGEEPAPAAAPSWPEDLAIDISSGAKLNLDFTGSVKVGKVRLGGVKTKGPISAELYPEFVTGSGSLESCPPEIGLGIILR